MLKVASLPIQERGRTRECLGKKLGWEWLQSSMLA